MTEDRDKNSNVLISLFKHHTWANQKLLDFCANLSDEQLGATAAGAYGSIRGTLAHLVYAETDYVQRVTGKEFPPPSQDQFPGFDGLKEASRWSGDEFLRLASTARADALVREDLPEESVVVEYPLGGFLTQVINHATEHRTQVSAIITQLGIEPPDMTGWGYMEEEGEFRETKSGGPTRA